MKKLALGLGLYLSASGPCFSAVEAPNQKFSRSFFFTHPVQQNIALKQALWHNLLYNKEKKTAIEAAVFFQKSTKPLNISQYFLPPNRTSLLFSTALNADVLPYWFNLPTNFSGTMALAPKQAQEGLMLEGRHTLGDLFDIDVCGVDFLKNWAAYWSIAFVHAKNNLHLTQSDVQNPGPTSNPVYDIVTAFNNPLWNYDKINGATSQGGVSEIRVGIATTLLGTERVHIATYSSLSLPTHTNISNVYLFNAEMGYNHVGIVWGINFQVPLTREKEKYLLALTINLENNFLIRNHQYRTFDINLKPWSRFILMRKKDDPNDVLIPGVNVLTHKMLVKAHDVIDFSAGLRFTKGSFEIDAGYALWAYGGETCRFTASNPWIPDYGLAGTLPNTSANGSTIKTRAANDPEFVTIAESNIDLKSGTMPPCFANKAYAAIGYKGIGDRFNTDAGLGFFVEVPHNVTDALSQWGLWFSAGVAF